MILEEFYFLQIISPYIKDDFLFLQEVTPDTIQSFDFSQGIELAAAKIDFLILQDIEQTAKNKMIQRM